MTIGASRQFDFIIVGAGSAGCALAYRLTESGRHRVLLVESGIDERWHWTRIPTGVAKILTGDRSIWRFTTGAEAGLGGRALYWPRGRMLGGSSRLNGMFWVHGDPIEYDRWRDAGNEGWGYADVLPLFRRMEAYAAGDPTVRGREGPLHVSDYRPGDPLTDAFLAACAQAGIPRVRDYNGGEYHGAGPIQFSTRRGLRWDACEGYLRPAMRRENLTVEVGAHVTRVVFEGGRAAGIEVQQGEATWIARAAGETVLAAGSIQSPQILELSGIGDAARLKALGIPVHHHLPGVGENLRDHLHARVMFEARDVATLNDILRDPLAKARIALRWALRRDGRMSVPGATAHAYVRSTPNRTQPDIKLQLHHLSSADERNPRRIVLDDFPGFSIGVVHQQPGSIGSVHAVSRDPLAPPAIRANYLSDPHDLAAFIRGVRIARQVAAAPSLAALVVREVRPGAPVESDEALEAYLRATLFSSYHPVGSCKMGTDALAVVDPALRVHGVPGLRVADASIFPTMPASNTNAAACLAGEKAADLLLAPPSD